jgi:hypothetical protein
MRGIAVLLVISIHSLQQPLNSWQTLVDAPLRPCVAIFLFASGYLTVLSGRVPLWKKLKTALIDPLCDRLRCGLHLNGITEPRDGPSYHEWRREGHRAGDRQFFVVRTRFSAKGSRELKGLGI